MYAPLSNTPGGQLSLRRNPAPALGTVEQYYLKHLFILFTEMVDGTIPVTRVRLYAEQIAETNLTRFQNIMLQCSAHYVSESKRFHRSQPQNRTGNKHGK